MRKSAILCNRLKKIEMHNKVVDFLQTSTLRKLKFKNDSYNKLLCLFESVFFHWIDALQRLHIVQKRRHSSVKKNEDEISPIKEEKGEIYLA